MKSKGMIRVKEVKERKKEGKKTGGSAHDLFGRGARMAKKLPKSQSVFKRRTKEKRKGMKEKKKETKQKRSIIEEEEERVDKKE